MSIFKKKSVAPVELEVPPGDRFKVTIEYASRPAYNKWIYSILDTSTGKTTSGASYSSKAAEDEARDTVANIKRKEYLLSQPPKEFTL